ncbi:MAG TPA: GNAT family N-acetyltransferase [Rhizomicrobium sp.]|jgi:RimJ/RimL family protein N-acetyltransferase
MLIQTKHLKLRPWRETDRDSFAAMNTDPEVMADLGGPLSRTQSDAKLDGYAAAFEQHGYCRWALENQNGDFLGYTGLIAHGADHPLGVHSDIGWRLVRHAWGHGYATEAARAALKDVFARTDLSEALAYTSPTNTRSMAVMARLGLERTPSRDCSFPNGWKALVWRTGPHNPAIARPS